MLTPAPAKGHFSPSALPVKVNGQVLHIASSLSHGILSILAEWWHDLQHTSPTQPLVRCTGGSVSVLWPKVRVAQGGKKVELCVEDFICLHRLADYCFRLSGVH